MRLSLIVEIPCRLLKSNSAGFTLDSKFTHLGVNSGFGVPRCCDLRRDPAGGLTGGDGLSPGVGRAKLEALSMCVRLDALQHHSVATDNGGLNLVMDQRAPEGKASCFLHHFILIGLGRKEPRSRIALDPQNDVANLCFYTPMTLCMGTSQYQLATAMPPTLIVTAMRKLTSLLSRRSHPFSMARDGR